MRSAAMQVLDRLYASVHPAATQHFGAFYSSELGGIVTHPAFMAIHVDDHMVHRGHGVVGCVPLHKGALHQLPQHLQRFKRSAFRAGITPPMSDAAIASVIKDTATASKKSDGACVRVCMLRQAGMCLCAVGMVLEKIRAQKGDGERRSRDGEGRGTGKEGRGSASSARHATAQHASGALSMHAPTACRAQGASGSGCHPGAAAWACRARSAWRRRST
jgi:hypothetical protein